MRSACCVLSLWLVMGTVAADPPPLKVGEPLPPVEGESLAGQAVTLPSAAAGAPALLMMGFTYGSRVPVEAWSDWFRKEVGPPATYYEMPMIGGLAKLARPFITGGMRKSTPVPLRNQVLIVSSKTGDWKARLGYASSSENHAFLVLIDRAGVVQWLHHGAFDAEIAAGLQRRIAALSATAP